MNHHTPTRENIRPRYILYSIILSLYRQLLCQLWPVMNTSKAKINSKDIKGTRGTRRTAVKGIGAIFLWYYSLVLMRGQSGPAIVNVRSMKRRRARLNGDGCFVRWARRRNEKSSTKIVKSRVQFGCVPVGAVWGGASPADETIGRAGRRARTRRKQSGKEKNKQYRKNKLHEPTAKTGHGR